MKSETEDRALPVQHLCHAMLNLAARGQNSGIEDKALALLQVEAALFSLRVTAILQIQLAASEIDAWAGKHEHRLVRERDAPAPEYVLVRITLAPPLVIEHQWGWPLLVVLLLPAKVVERREGLREALPILRAVAVVGSFFMSSL